MLDHTALAAMLALAPANDNALPAPAAEVFVPREKSRRPKALTAIPTPEEFFRHPTALQTMARQIARRFVRRLPSLNEDDLAQDAAEEILKCALPHRWSPSKGVPFGGFAWRSTIYKMTGVMWKASVPVSGTFSHLAEVAAVRALYLDAPAGSSDEGDAGTWADVIGCDDVEDGSAPCDPETAAEAARVRAALAYALRGYAPEAALTLTDLVEGRAQAADLTAAEIPEGWSRAGLTRAAAKLRRALAGAPAEGAAGEAADLDVWG